MNRQISTIAFLLPLVMAGCQESGCAALPTAPPGTPPAAPTHHAVVTGTVIGARGQPLAAVNVGARYAPGCRAASAVGGGTTDENGAYRAELQFFSTGDQRAVDVYLQAFRYGTAGSRVVIDSVRVSLVAVPLAEQPRETRAPTIQLLVE